MCKAIDDMIRDGEKRITCLIKHLAEQNRMQDIVRWAEDEEKYIA